MNKIIFTLSLFVVTLLIGLAVSVKPVQAGIVPTCTDSLGVINVCTIVCADQPGGVCDDSGDDVGTPGVDVYCGSDGADTINADGGDDIVCGGKGNDIIDGEGDNDDISGGKGNDTIDGSAGDDVLDGGQGNDTINGGDGDDDIYGGQGNDDLNGDADDDYIEGGMGTDMIDGGSAGTDMDECYGGPQDDTFNECECGSPGPTNPSSGQSGGEADVLPECGV